MEPPRTMLPLRHWHRYFIINMGLGALVFAVLLHIAHANWLEISTVRYIVPPYAMPLLLSLYAALALALAHYRQRKNTDAARAQNRIAYRIDKDLSAQAVFGGFVILSLLRSGWRVVSLHGSLPIERLYLLYALCVLCGVAAVTVSLVAKERLRAQYNVSEPPFQPLA